MLVRLRRDSGDRIAEINDVNTKRRDLKLSDDIAVKSISRSIAACMYVLGVKLHGQWPVLVWYPYGRPDCQDRGYRAYAIRRMTVIPNPRLALLTATCINRELYKRREGFLRSCSLMYSN